MKRLLIVMTGLFLFAAMNSNGQELVYEFVPDTTIYEYPSNEFTIIPTPEDFFSKTTDMNWLYTSVFALKRKKSDTYDIFSWTGKIGTLNITGSIKNQYSDGIRPILTKKIFDNDEGWEVLLCNSSAGVIIIDDDGSTLFNYSATNPDSFYCYANIGCDGSSTYVMVQLRGINNTSQSYKLFRFRTNISPASPQSLAKKSAGGPNAMMVFGPGPSSGDYQISLIPTGGGKTSVQLFDMLGRLVYEKRIDDLTKPVSFSIPAAQTSRSPFITRVQDQNGTVLKKEIPVR